MILKTEPFNSNFIAKLRSVGLNETTFAALPAEERDKILNDWIHERLIGSDRDALINIIKGAI
jgi:hypothetical protein